MRSSTVLAALAGIVFADQPLQHDFAGLQAGQYGSSPNQTYRSSNVTSPLFNYNTWREDLIVGDKSSHIFLTLNYGGAGPYIFRDDDLSLVYADASFGTTMNARVQTVNGIEYLSVWHGAQNGGHAKGHCVLYNNRYQLKYNVSIVNPLTVNADMHECEATADGTVLLTAYQDKPYNLSALGYTGDDVLADSCFQEVDAETNALKFSWCASDHFGLDMTFQDFTKEKRQHVSPKEGVDVYHINSLQKTKEGHYLVSLRPLRVITYINGTSGKPIWNLNGKMNNFTDITSMDVLIANGESEGALSFGWQHDARFLNEEMKLITLFDNHHLSTKVGCNGPTCSRGRLLEIDASNLDKLTVQLVKDYRSPQGLASMIMGSTQIVTGKDGAKNVLVGWGSNAEFTEHTIDGELVRDVQFGALDPRRAFGGFGGQTSYRVYKQSWHGYPSWPPSIATDRNGKLWVSWNGATEVRRWKIYGSESIADLRMSQGIGHGGAGINYVLEHLRLMRTVKKTGFETEVVLGGFSPVFVTAAAVDMYGRIIGITETVEMGSPAVTCQLDCLVLESVLLT